MKSSDQSKYGFWDVVTQKARSVLEDDNAFQQRQNSARTQVTFQISNHTLFFNIKENYDLMQKNYSDQTTCAIFFE